MVPVVRLVGEVGRLPPPFDGSGNVQAPWAILPSCLSTKVELASIPGTLGGCVAKEQWWPIASSNCPATTLTGPNLRCLQITSTVIMGTDPVFGR